MSAREKKAGTRAATAANGFIRTHSLIANFASHLIGLFV
jgi:hypothetical protein